jgi:DNA polymerase III subunit gamma/tau
MKNYCNLADEYRPKRFGEFYGQELATRQVSGLIRPALFGRTKVSKSLLLHGPVGTGKTSLAEVYATALNCQDNRPDGSPCLACQACLLRHTPEGGFFKYNVATKGGGTEPVVNLLRELNRDVACGYRVVFLDEAHTMNSRACEALLGFIDDARENVCFCLATTEPEVLGPALLSRLLPIQLRALPAGAALSLLEDVCGREGLSASAEALSLVVGLSHGRARDVLRLFGQVADCCGDRHIDVEAVQHVLGVDAREGLIRYMSALAGGNDCKQAEAVRCWNGGSQELLAYTRAFLASLYYNNVLGHPLSINGVVDSIQSERASILRDLRLRFGTAANVELKPFFLRLLNLCSQSPVSNASADCYLQLALLQAEANAEEAVAPPAQQIERIEMPRSPSEPGYLNDFGRRPPVDATVWEGTDRFLTSEDAVELIERSSFYVQEHGRGFNEFLELTLDAPDGAAYAREQASGLLLELEGMDEGTSGPPLAYAAVLERRGALFTLLISAHIPAHATAPFQHWAGELGTVGRLTRKTLPRTRPEVDLQSHWICLKRLCAGLDDKPGKWELDRLLSKPLRDLLKLDPITNFEQPFTATPGGLFATSQTISREAIDCVRLRKAVPLSAIADLAFHAVFAGWELDEYEVRRSLKRTRDNELAEIERLHARDPGRQEAEKSLLIESWSEDPRSWIRPWKRWR